MRLRRYTAMKRYWITISLKFRSELFIFEHKICSSWPQVYRKTRKHTYINECGLIRLRVAAIGSRLLDRFEHDMEMWSSPVPSSTAREGTNIWLRLVRCYGVERDGRGVQRLTFIATLQCCQLLGEHIRFIDVSEETMDSPELSRHGWEECWIERRSLL